MGPGGSGLGGVGTNSNVRWFTKCGRMAGHGSTKWPRLGHGLRVKRGKNPLIPRVHLPVILALLSQPHQFYSLGAARYVAARSDLAGDHHCTPRRERPNFFIFTLKRSPNQALGPEKFYTWAHPTCPFIYIPPLFLNKKK